MHKSYTFSNLRPNFNTKYNQNYYPDNTRLTKDSNSINLLPINNNNNNKTISFIIHLTTGQHYIYRDNLNTILKLSINKFMQEKGLTSLGFKFKCVFLEKKFNNNLSLLENKKNQNSSLL